jgi:DNA-binding NarL/FixJ family response regulator
VLALSIAATPVSVPVWPHNVHLTPSERDVLLGIEAGLTNVQIALTRGTSVNPVRNQVAALLEKLQLGSRTELAAARLGAFAHAAP